MAQFGRPTSDITVNGWTWSGGGLTANYQAVDETSPDDATTWVQSPSNPDSTVPLILGITPLLDGGLSGTKTARLRGRKIGGGKSIIVGMSTRDGVNVWIGVVPTIESGALTTSYTTVTGSASGTQSSAEFDRVYLYGVATGGGSPTDCAITWAEVEFPDSGPATQNITPGLISDSTVYSPTVAPGSVAVTPGLVSDTTVYSPSASVVVTAPLVGGATVYAPTAVPGQVNVTVGLIQESTVYSPTAQPGATNLTVGLIQDSTVYSPTLAVGSVAVTPGLIQDSTVYSLTLAIGSVAVAPSLLQDSAIYSPTLAVGSVAVTPGLVQDSAVYDFTALVAGSNVGAGFISDSLVYEPTLAVGSVSVAPGLISDSAVYEFTLNQQRIFAAPLIFTFSGVQSIVIYQVIHIGLIDEAAVYSPELVASSELSVAPDVLDFAAVYAPWVQSGLSVGLISEGEVFGPSLAMNLQVGLITDSAVLDLGLHQITYVTPVAVGDAVVYAPTFSQQQNVQIGLVYSSDLFGPAVAPQPVNVSVAHLFEGGVYAITFTQDVVSLGEVSISSRRLHGASASHTVLDASVSATVPDVVVSHRLTGEG